MADLGGSSNFHRAKKDIMDRAGVTYSFFPLLILPPGKMSIY